MSSHTSQSPILDHFVILVSHKTLLEISEYTNGQFTLAPGGTHADGLTTNKLILLSDGVYLELIAFFDDADPEKRRQHRWGNEREGTIIDWAFTLPSENDFGPIQQRVRDAATGFSYTNPIPGGRTKPDGTVLKWAICTPKDDHDNGVGPGSMPFWCLDRTPRVNRVPYKTETHLTRHPNGVQGVSSVLVQFPDGGDVKMKGAYDAIFGGAWKYEVPSRSSASRHSVTLSGDKAAIRLVFNGSKRGQVELLPGLLFDIEESAQ
ncbi:uncharacterized protein N7484_010945 [Penicillium longicatenatum]|uniref:uncharacterized protein n=1 Tax=Penicillium longicatenatum TaxID=1561947 RepID=UPI0025468E91|nr:uncharacterized protein N7484_010945 [Penicillium longicatenatum]KAJ5630845.1 hypothetical protein N7484_010945 [Penicillium longicatenatum]